MDAEEKILYRMNTVVRAQSPSWYMNPTFGLPLADEDRIYLKSAFDSC